MLIKTKSKLLRFILVACAVMLSIGSVSAQNVSVSGTVTDSFGEPLIGVYVLEEGTQKGATTDLDGKYEINVASNSSLVFSLMGMKTSKVPVNGKTVVNCVMEEDAVLLEDVVVVGFGTQKKENLTGAVASVDVDKDLKGRPIADIGRGLQGTTPGLSVTIPSGEVGSDPVMKIRGSFASIEGSSSPLILVDNVEIPSIQMVNPDDIASISVLKDAASASIYGAKAAFGVILITTKKGSSAESVNVSYSGNVSFQNVSKSIEMGGIDALEYSILAAERVGSTSTGAFWKVTREGYEKAVEWEKTYGGKLGPNDPMVYGRDWYVDANGYKIGLRTYDPYDYMIREWAPAHTHNLSVNGKSGRTDYNISLGYVNQQGMIEPAKQDDFSRYNASVRVSTEINDIFTVRVGAMYSKRDKRYAYSTASTTADPRYYLYRWGPTSPLGSIAGNQLMRDPVSEVYQANTASLINNYLSVNAGVTANITKDWTFDFDYTYAGTDEIHNKPGTKYTAYYSWGSALPVSDASGNPVYVDNTGSVVSAGSAGAMQQYELDYYTYTAAGSSPDHIYRSTENANRHTINVRSDYNWKINENHTINAMVGMSSVAYDEESHWAQKTTLFDISNPQFDLATGTQTSGGAFAWESQLGFYGRINYNYKEKYLLEANLRYDGTSKFPTDLQWRYFPSFSAGWRVTEESWMEWSESFLSSLKLRGSWGIIGDQTVPNSLYLSSLTGYTTSWVLGGAKLNYYGTPSAVSSAITWQDITTLDLGADARFLKGNLGFSFDWFQRDTRNMIVPQDGVSETFGTTAPKFNDGSLRTNGFEIVVDYGHSFKNGLSINFTASLADSKTKITAYGDTQSIDSWYVGKTYGEIWGYETDRLYQKSDFVYDSNGGLVTETINGVTVYKLADANGASQWELQNSSTFIFGPGDVKFKDQNGDGFINDGSRLVDDHGDLKVIGNETPRYEYSFRAGADYKGFDFSIFFQGVGSRQVWGDGMLAIPGYNSSDGAMAQAFAGDFWSEDNTGAFYPRPYNQAGSNDTNNMQVQDRYLLDMSYLRIKNITLGYKLPAKLTQKANISSVRFYVALENFFTFDHLNGLPIDPEVVSGYSMWNDDNYNSGRTGMGAPAFKSASFGLQLNF